MSAQAALIRLTVSCATIASQSHAASVATKDVTARPSAAQVKDALDRVLAGELDPGEPDAEAAGLPEVIPEEDAEKQDADSDNNQESSVSSASSSSSDSSSSSHKKKKKSKSSKQKKISKHKKQDGAKASAAPAKAKPATEDKKAKALSKASRAKPPAVEPKAKQPTAGAFFLLACFFNRYHV